MIIFFDRYTDDTKKVQETIKCIGLDIKVVVLDDEGFLPQGISTPYEYFISKQNCEKYLAKGMRNDSLVIPQYWETYLNGSTGSIYYMGQERATIYFSEWRPEDRAVGGADDFVESDENIAITELPEEHIVQRVEWRMEDGCRYRVDFYNKYGLKYASEFHDVDGTVESKVFYSERNQEAIVEYPANDVVTLLENGMVKAFFNSRKEFIEYFISEVTADKKMALFIQDEKMLDSLGIKPDKEQAWDSAWFSDDSLLDKYRSLGGKNGFRFYAIPKHYPLNEAKGEVLILTMYDQIEKVEEVVRGLPDVTFHIGANTLMSDKLMNLEKLGNVKLYPGVSQNALDELWEKCDFYLDINLYGEIRDAVNVAQQKNLLVMAFDNTVHHPELLVKGCMYPAQEYKKMVLVIKYILKSPELMQKLLILQQRKRKAIYKKLLKGE